MRGTRLVQMNCMVYRVMGEISPPSPIFNLRPGEVRNILMSVFMFVRSHVSKNTSKLCQFSMHVTSAWLTLSGYDDIAICYIHRFCGRCMFSHKGDWC